MLIFLPQAVHAQANAPVISEIRIRGNKYTEESLIRFSCGLNVGQRLVLPDDAARAIRNLYKMGMFSDVRVLVDPDVKKGVAVEIVVKEYPKLGKIEFEGNKAFRDRKLTKNLGLIRGEFLSPQETKKAQEKISDMYRKEGYLLATVSVETGKQDEEGRAPLIFHIHEGRKVHLKRIRFFGNKAFSDKKLQKQMKDTKLAGFLTGAKFDAEKYPEDKKRVVEFYQKNGYRDAKIVRDSLYYDSQKKNLYIDITLKEGPKFTFGKITWDGNEHVSNARMAHLIVADSGAVYSSGRIDKSMEQITALYGNIGYIAATVTKRETPRPGHKVNVHFQVIENKPWKIREITISGNTKTKDRVIRRELWIKPGEIFQRSLIERSVRNLQQLNYFSNVDVKPKPVEQSSELDLAFKVDEKPTGTASVGAGYSAQNGLMGTIALQIPNFLGNGQRVDFQWAFGTVSQSFRLGFTEPWLLNTPTSVSGTVFRQTQQYYSEFDQQSQGFDLSVGRRLRHPDYTSVAMGYQINQVKYSNFATTDLQNSPALHNNLTSSVYFNFTRDSRDLPVFATSGSVFSYKPTIAGGWLGGSTDFLKQDFIADVYYPLFWKVALNVKATLGIIAGYGNTAIPFLDLYTPGGVNLYDGTMLRGYPDQSVGPRNASGTPIGGRSQLLFNTQITIPLVKHQLYGLLFADAGNAWQNVTETSVFDLRRSVGFGIRIVAPVVGIMGFDFGWGIDRRLVDGQAPQMVTHFQFGPQF